MSRRRVLVLSVAVCVVALPLLLVAGALLRNDLPLADPPGVGARLTTYLTTNVALLHADSVFPELKPRHVPYTPAEILPILERVVRELGWEVAAISAGRAEVRAVVTTPILGFRDDVRVWAEPATDGGAVVFAVSRSRVGKGDLGANTRHLLDFLGRLDAATRLPDSMQPVEPDAG